jgi:hypothetical protein
MQMKHHTLTHQANSASRKVGRHDNYVTRPTLFNFATETDTNEMKRERARARRSFVYGIFIGCTLVSLQLEAGNYANLSLQT